MNKKNIRWFAVKTLYLTRAYGRSSAKLRKDEQKTVLFEERIVLHRARNIDSAIRIGEDEARKYSKAVYKNAFGQIVRTKYLGFCDAFELFDFPENGVEVFSSTQILKSLPNQSALVQEKLGRRGKSEVRLRRKFLNSEL